MSFWTSSGGENHKKNNRFGLDWTMTKWRSRTLANSLGFFYRTRERSNRKASRVVVVVCCCVLFEIDVQSFSLSSGYIIFILKTWFRIRSDIDRIRIRIQIQPLMRSRIKTPLSWKFYIYFMIIFNKKLLPLSFLYFHQGFGSGSDVFAWIRIRFSNFSASGSGFSPRIPLQESVQKGLLNLFIRRKLKFMTKDRQKLKKAKISY